MAINFDGSYFQTFDSLSSAGTGNTWSNNGTIPGWYLFRQPVPGTDILTYNANNGSSNTGSFYSYGDTNASDRALGGLGSGGTYFGSPATGAIAGWIAFAATNTTGTTLSQANLTFDGEQWRNGGNTTPQTMVLEYGFGSTFASVTDWTAPGSSFDSTSPVATATAGAVDGNGAGLIANRGGTLSNLGWNSGDTLWIRWVERNDPGNDHGLAIDNVSLTTGTTPPPPTTLVAIVATDADASEENQDPGTFRISRTGDDTADALTVNYTIGGTATNGTDYTPNLTGTAVIAAGQTSVDIIITPVDDDLVEGSETVVLTLVDGADYDLGTSASATITIADNDFNITRIYDIQGAAHRSPLVGQMVTTTGIVTAVDTNGFYLQDPFGDDNIATSDAIFVFTSSAPTVAVGDEIQISGTVSEFTPGGVASRNLSTTQLSGSLTITPLLNSGNPFPAATLIGAGGRVPPTENIDDDAFTIFDPINDGIDFFESLEGMLVTAQNFHVIDANNNFGEIFGVIDNGFGATGLSDRGTLNISPDDFNPERIQLQFDNGVTPSPFPLVTVGDNLGNVTGVLSYGFGNFEIVVTEDFTNQVVGGGLRPEVSTLTRGGDQLLVATYNVLNLDPNDNDGDADVANGRFGAIAQQIVNNLNRPDVIALQEVQDNNGSVNDGVTAADVTLQTLVDAIVAAGGPTYAFIDNPFIGNNTSGGQPGGNIRNAYLYDPSRVNLVAGSVATIGGQGSGESFAGARLPLIASFEFNGETVTLVNNHFSSKGGSAPILGTAQPFEARQEDPTVNGSLDERQIQSAAVQGYVNGLLGADPTTNVVVLGDFNEFEFVSPVRDLAANTGLTNLTEQLPENERYTFIFQGNSQSLDHILVSGGLAATAEVDAVHVNTEFAVTPQRASDHDPVLARLTLAPALNIITGTNRRDVLVGTDGRDRIEGLRGNDTIFGGAGNDIIFGGPGNDTIFGGDGDDIIVGGPGFDILTGGRGRDTFVFESVNDGLDIIRDFNPAEDFIDLSAIFSGSNYGSTTPFADYVNLINFGLGNNTTVTVDPNGDRPNLFNRPLVVLEGVTPNQLSEANFLV